MLGRGADVEIEFTKSQLIAGIPGTLFCIWYVLKKHWLANNTLGLAFSIQVTLTFLPLFSFSGWTVACVHASIGNRKGFVSLTSSKGEYGFEFLGFFTTSHIIPQAC